MTFIAVLGSALVAMASLHPAAATMSQPPNCPAGNGWEGEACCPGRECLAAGTVCIGRGAGTCRVPPPCGGMGEKCCDPLWYPNRPKCDQADWDCVVRNPAKPNKKFCEKLTCGGPSQMCCPPNPRQPNRAACQSDHECQSGQCVRKEQCGIWDKPGCGPNKDQCEDGLVLNARLLCDMPCGGHNKMCCEDGSLLPTKCDQTGSHPLVCANNKCVKCGAKGQRVCNGGDRPACRPFLIPIGNHCRKCGHKNGQCCDAGRRGSGGKHCRSTRNMCVSNKCKPCGGPNQRVCHNGGPQCRGMLMPMNGMCMGGRD